MIARLLARFVTELLAGCAGTGYNISFSGFGGSRRIFYYSGFFPFFVNSNLL